MSEASQNTDTLIKLARSASLHGGKFKDFILELLPFLGDTMKAKKVSFWIFRSSDDVFESIQTYNPDSKEASTGVAIDKSKYPAFSKELAEEFVLEVKLGDDNPDHEEFIINYMIKEHRKTWISVQVWNDNRLFGILSMEWNTKRDFTDQERLTLVTASSMISQCYDALMRLKEEILHKSELRDLKDEEKERKKLAKKLADHAFYTSHHIRHPCGYLLTERTMHEAIDSIRHGVFHNF
ncbi:MAG: hypothetical protein AAF391_13740, partial [Bacteroidota bacterium]